MAYESDKKRLSDKKIAVILFIVLLLLISIIIFLLANTDQSASHSDQPVETIAETEVNQENTQPQESTEFTEETEATEETEDVTVRTTETESPAKQEKSSSASNITPAVIESTKSMLGVPSDLKTTHSVSPPYYWEGGGIYLVHVAFYYNGEVIASADINAKTGAPEKSFLMYSEPEYESSSVDEIYSYDGYDPDYVYVPEEEECEHSEPAPGSAPPEGFYETDESSTYAENTDLED